MFFTKYGNFGQAIQQFEEVEAVLMAMDVAVPLGTKSTKGRTRYWACPKKIDRIYPFPAPRVLWY